MLRIQVFVELMISRDSIMQYFVSKGLEQGKWKWEKEIVI